MTCNIVEVGKRRDGGCRYWCREHHADATAKYGVAREACVAAHDTPISPSQSRDLDISSFPGGVALWGAVPPVYDTTDRPLDRGIHVHARLKPGSPKFIDQTYRRLSIPVPAAHDLFSEAGWVELDELDAINFMVSQVFGFSPVSVNCTICGYPHLDRDWFAVNPHRRHLCHGCGRQFSVPERGIGNPMSAVRERLRIATRQPVPATCDLEIRQADYPGGLQLWGSNSAIVWTGEAHEREGIHVHAFGASPGENPMPDGTFRRVTVDGEVLDAAHVRFYMAQNVMPHLYGRVVELICPSCSTPHFDVGELAYTPHLEHQCHACGDRFASRTLVKKTIGNPFVGTRNRLARFAVAPMRTDRIELRPETI